MITSHTAETLIAFERRIVALFAAGDLPFLIHLSGGNEGQLLDIFREVRADDWVFSGHRSHYHALLKGIPEDRVEQFIRDGRSMFIFSREHRFVTSAILGGTAGIAAGVALDIKQRGARERVWCFLGDGAEDQGHVYEAIRYVTGHDLPCTFVIEDNDRQVDTSHEERWGTAERWQWPGPALQQTYANQNRHVRRYHYTPTFPHGGAGLPAGSVTFKPDILAKFAIN